MPKKAKKKPRREQEKISLRSNLVLLIVIVILVTSALRLPLLSIPFERDEGEYAYIAWRLEHNELPYRDWVDQKPPGVFWVYRAALALPMEPIRAVHFMGMLWAAASAGALVFLSRRFLNNIWAGVAGLLFAIIFVDPMVQGTVSNTELFMLLPLILSQLAFFRATEDGPRRAMFMALCGVLTGVAVAFKQVAGVNWLFLAAVYPFFVIGGKRLRGALSFAGWSALGAAAVWCLIAGFFFLRKGLDEFIYHVFTHNLEYLSATSWPARWNACLGTLNVLSGTQAVVWVLAIAGLMALLWGRRGRLLVYLVGWLVSSMVGVSASGYYFPHYFQQLLPPLALAAAVGAEWMRQLRGWSGVAANVRSGLLALVILALPAVRLYPFLFKYTPTEAVEIMYPLNPFGRMPALGARLAELTRPDDKVFVFGAEPELLFYAQRVSATRYIFLFPLYGPYAGVLEKQRATAQEIVDARPAAAFYLPNQLFFIGDSEQFFTNWSVAYLRYNYRADSYLTIDAFYVEHLLVGEGGREPVVPPDQQAVGALLVRTTP
jgi:4-amino-4-deoxy-L-arabinose transferase-like glycosyltransferase